MTSYGTEISRRIKKQCDLRKDIQEGDAKVALAGSDVCLRSEIFMSLQKHARSVSCWISWQKYASGVAECGRPWLWAPDEGADPQSKQAMASRCFGSCCCHGLGDVGSNESWLIRTCLTFRIRNRFFCLGPMSSTDDDDGLEGCLFWMLGIQLFVLILLGHARSAAVSDSRK